MADETGNEDEAGKLAEMEQAAKDQVYSAAQGATARKGGVSPHKRENAPNPSEDIKDFTGRTQRNLDAATAFGTNAFHLATQTTQMWLKLTQKIGQRNLDALSKLATAKSLQDVTKIQQEAIQGGLDDIAMEIRNLAPPRNE